jgi:ribosomal protein S20
MSDEKQKAIAEIVSRVPEWVRKDLLAPNKATRARAEETVSAMIADALANLAG